MDKLSKINQELKDYKTKPISNIDDLVKGKRIMTFGTFDHLHIGHIKIIEHMLEFTNEDNIYIGVSSDYWNSKKGKNSDQTQEMRKRKLENTYPKSTIFFEHHDFPEETWPELFDKYEIDYIFMGGDHKDNLKYIDETITPKGKQMKILFFERTPKISSTLIRRGLK